MSSTDIHAVVQDAYASAARQAGCCGAENTLAGDLYDDADRAGLPEDAVAAALGCANPTALADLRPGETVLDLGSGGGIDVLLSARRVGSEGFVYGLDMTPEMLELAERNRVAAGAENVRFLEGRIEQVPLPDASVDVVLSNCVVNLSPDKPGVLSEAYRVLRPGGRLAIADIATRGALPEAIQHNLAAWAGCVAGAMDVDELQALLVTAGFQDAAVQIVRSYGIDDLESLASGALAELRLDTLPDEQLAAAEGRLVSVFVRGRKGPTVAPISRQALRDAIEVGTVVPLDAQDAGWFEREHLPGAIRVRPEDLAELEQRLPAGKDTAVAVYCWSETCGASARTAEQLIELGYRDVRRYAAGKREWIDAGLPLEGQPG